MKDRRVKFQTFLLIGAGIVGIALCLTLFDHIGGLDDGTLEGQIVGVRSGESVWRARIVLDGKSTIKYISTTYRLTEIPPGTYTLKVTAPNYRSVNRPVEVKAGKNVFNISMVGTKIPDLKGILAFAEAVDEGLEVEIRLTNSKEIAITHYPSLPFRLEGSVYLRKGTAEPYVRGQKAFEGLIELFWDAEDPLAKNKGLIPWSEITFDRSQAKGQYAILEVVLHTSQGTFEYTNNEVKLFRERLYD